MSDLRLPSHRISIGWIWLYAARNATQDFVAYPHNTTNHHLLFGAAVSVPYLARRRDQTSLRVYKYACSCLCNRAFCLFFLSQFIQADFPHALFAVNQSSPSSFASVVLHGYILSTFYPVRFSLIPKFSRSETLSFLIRNQKDR